MLTSLLLVAPFSAILVSCANKNETKEDSTNETVKTEKTLTNKNDEAASENQNPTNEGSSSTSNDKNTSEQPKQVNNKAVSEQNNAQTAPSAKNNAEKTLLLE